MRITKRSKTDPAQKIFFVRFDTSLKKRNMLSGVLLRFVCIVYLVFESLRVKNLRFRTSDKRHLFQTLETGERIPFHPISKPKE
ncbi:hypothetical protein LEP1GSC086_3544 [Leptospira weilii str. LNT 1234]|nr:hypothetical protein LEP1GSC086_3544 [Leptospira weilii str. LNT 1234]